MNQIIRVQGAIARVDQQLAAMVPGWRITGLEVDRQTFATIEIEGRQLPTVNSAEVLKGIRDAAHVVVIDGVTITRRQVPVSPAQVKAGAEMLRAMPR